MTFPNNSVIPASGWNKQNIYLSIQCSVMFNLTILHEFNASHHQEAKKDKKDKKDKVNCEINEIQHCTR